MNDSDHAAGREREVIHAFVDLSGELVTDYDVLDMLSTLTTRCARLLDVASAGLLLADLGGRLHLAASSSESTHDLEVYQLQRDEGPCLDCYRLGEPVVAPHLGEAQHRWPQFVRVARAAGFLSVHALPLRLHGSTLGTLGLFGTRAGTLHVDDLALAQALAHVAAVAIVNQRTAVTASTVNAQLQRALDSRVVLEQAKGVLAHTGGLSIDEAFAALRRYARDHGHKLGEVAAQVVQRDLRGEAVVAHARSAGVLP